MRSIYGFLRSADVQDRLPELWLLTWSVVLAAIGVATVAYARSHRAHRMHESAAANPPAFRFGPGDRVRLAVLAGPLAVYAFFMLYRQDFAAYDNDIFTEYILRGKFYVPPVWPALGRFFPLGHQEWNVVGLATTAPSAFFLLPVLQLLVVVALLFLLLRTFPAWVFIAVTLLLVTTPAFVHPFSSLSIPERNLMLWLLVFVLAVTAHGRNPSPWTFGIALAATHVALYYKEPAFVVFVSFSGVRLVHALWTERGRPNRDARAFLGAHALDIAVLALCAVFLAWYAVVYVPYRSLGYAESRAINPAAALDYYLRSNVLLVAFLVVSLGRMTVLLVSRQPFDRVWDALAVGAVGYLAFYVAIGLAGPYFLAPVNVIALLYVFHVLSRQTGGVPGQGLPAKASVWRTGMLVAVCVAVAWQNAARTPRIIQDRVNFIEGRARLVSFLLAYTREPGVSQLKLHFPAVHEPYAIYYFSCFLHYKHRQPSPGAGEGPHEWGAFTLTGRFEFPRNLCVPWNADHHCAHAEDPQGGDLVVILPGDPVSEDALHRWRASGELLFHYSPVPAGSRMDAYVFRKTM